ncbi:MAG: glycosyltransferase family 4 protein [Eubacterium sp.]|nr:glycosyltransferase family 4 protein [Eubacterium sp.]
MNILFLTLCDITSIQEKNIYTDLLRVFLKAGHEVYIISPNEKQDKGDLYTICEDNCVIIKVYTGSIQKTNYIKKGINTIRLESLILRVAKKYFFNIPLDLILYSTPPITLYKVIAYLKSKNNAKTYLLLKDIFPQNAVDLNLLHARGILYTYFRKKEIQMYQISDYIGCMSKRNVEYILEHNSYLNPDIVFQSPNCIEITSGDARGVCADRELILGKYSIPINKRLYIYGGNLGKPQDIPFIISCLQKLMSDKKNYFIICGNGTEYEKLEKFVSKKKPENVKLLPGLPQKDYDKLVRCCHVGLLFLDYRFTIPNFPSRILSYMQCELPVLACTDLSTDIGDVIINGNFGWWCPSNSSDGFYEKVQEISLLNDAKLKEMGENGRKTMESLYDVKIQAVHIQEALSE